MYTYVAYICASRKVFRGRSKFPTTDFNMRASRNREPPKPAGLYNVVSFRESNRLGVLDLGRFPI